MAGRPRSLNWDTDSVVRQFRGGLAALVACATAIVALQVLPWHRGDFAPFVMTITEWDTQRVGLSDGRTLAGTSVYRLEYHDRSNWTYILISDEVPGWGIVQIPGQGYACRDGAYGSIDPSGAFQVRDRGSHLCDGIGRWIAYGMASSLRWNRTISGNLVTYTTYGERVSFDRKTGLPTRYEAGLSPGAIGRHVTTFDVERP